MRKLQAGISRGGTGGILRIAAKRCPTSIFGLGEPAARLVAEIFEGVDSKSLQNSNAESS
jgi:hypothetical protein